MSTRVLIVIIISCLSLSGCAAGVLIAGGGAGGVAAADNRGLAQKTRDQSLQQQVGNLVYHDQQIHDGAQVVISVYQDEVLLAGQARTQALRAKAEKFAYSVEGVKRVYNQITIGEPISVWAQTQDTWLTTKVKSKLLATKGLPIAHVKVVSDNSIVYLLGHINQQQADLAAHVASSVDGVRQVVTLFRDSSTNEGITTKPIATTTAQEDTAVPDVQQQKMA